MDVARAFQDRFGAVPAGVWSAPGRVNLIGEHTDYNGGLAMPIGLSQRTYAAVAPREDGVLRIASLQAAQPTEIDLADVGPSRPAGWAAYVAGVGWSLQQAGYAVRGLDVLVDGRVPLGAGLSSSAALECAVGAAWSDLDGLEWDGLGLLASPGGRAALADRCRVAENEIAGAPTGGMDQLASMLAQADHALLLDVRDGHTEQVPFPAASAGLTLLVIDTKAHHALVDGQYGQRRATCEAAASALGVATLREIAIGDLDAALAQLGDEVSRRRVRHVVTEIDRVEQAADALRAGDWPRLGRLFTASHTSLRDDYDVSAPELDLAVATAEAYGAIGARMTGGGFGGSAIALVPDAEVAAVSAAVPAAYADAGFTPPHLFPAQASAGARREA